MTTIAYKDGILAYDSRRTIGDMISTDTANKLVVKGGAEFVMAGATADIPLLIDWALGEQLSGSVDACGLMVQGKSLYMLGFSKAEGPFKAKVDMNNVYAMGSGLEYAIGAMDMGADAIQAVKIACGRDLYSGGKVRHIKVFQ